MPDDVMLIPRPKNLGTFGDIGINGWINHAQKPRLLDHGSIRL